jgi:hypothetical protein
MVCRGVGRRVGQLLAVEGYSRQRAVTYVVRMTLDMTAERVECVRECVR